METLGRKMESWSVETEVVKADIESERRQGRITPVNTFVTQPTGLRPRENARGQSGRWWQLYRWLGIQIRNVQSFGVKEWEQVLSQIRSSHSCGQSSCNCLLVF